jgi:hypothetical protein
MLKSMDKNRTAARVEELLAPFDAIERTKGRAPAFIADWLGLSLPTTYRRIERGEIRAVKLAGAERPRGRGTSGLLRVSLADAAAFRAAHEIGGDPRVQFTPEPEEAEAR